MIWDKKWKMLSNRYFGFTQLVRGSPLKMKWCTWRKDWQVKDDLHQPRPASHPDCQWPTDYCSGELISYTGFNFFSPAEQVLKWDNSSNMTCLVKCYFSRQWAKGVSRSNYREARTCHSFRWKLETLTWKKCDYIWQLGTLTWKKCDNIWNNVQPLFNLRRTTCCIDLVTFVITDLYLRGISLCKPLSRGFASHKDSHFISPRIDTQ